MERILLCIEHKENRRLLAEWLEKKYHVIQYDSNQSIDGPFDLGILDGPAMDRLWEQIKARKQLEMPVFLPFLLITSRQDVEIITRHLWRTIDELILAPIVKVELQARVEILLRARKLSQEAEQRYYTLAENSPIGTFIVQDDLIVYANPGMAKMSKKTPGTFPGFSFLEFIDPAERERVFSHSQDKIGGKSAPDCYETKIMTTQGVRWVELLVTPITYRGKTAILGIVLDLTERRQSEEELRKYRLHLEEMVKERTGQLVAANEQLESEILERRRADEETKLAYTGLNQIFNAGADGMMVIDRHFQILRLNDPFCSLLGINKAEAIGKMCYEVLRLNFCRNQMCPLPKIFGGKERIEFDIEIEGKEGRKIPCILTATPFRGTDGELIGFVENFKDITERKKMEEELQKTQKLESLGLLAGGIAHDFNNILTAIGGSLFLMKQYGKVEDKVSKILAGAEQEIRRAKGLTQQLLTFAKGGAPIKKTTFISRLLREAVSFTLSGSKIKGEFSLSEGLWPVEIDEGQISQVMNNIILNAVQAMPGGGIISVRGENIPIGAEKKLPLKEGKYIKVSIKDQGRGIQEEYRTKVFDPFFSTKPKGTGLGLTIAYSIMKRHDGYITAESAEGVGTTFHLYLPASEKELFKVKEIKEEKELYTGRGRILFMDDEQQLRNVTSRMLEYLGYEVITAKDGTEAIELYRKAQESGQVFDAVIMDLTVPGGMGGLESMQRLLEVDPRIRAVVSSGYSQDPVMADYRTYGFKGVISKPYEVSELSEVLHKILH
ncbi:MAG: PAS domain S-box protein [Deltaproteobacteria bacterium]|nr:PAS domain S-box protein [Deltaproteobacteria bacterium]